MKIRILLLLAILLGISSSPFISKANEKAAKEVSAQRTTPPVERQKEQVKRPKSKKVKPTLTSQKKEQKKKKWLPWLLGLLSIPLVVGALAWGIYFLPLLTTLNIGCGGGCLGLGGSIFLTIVVGFFGTVLFALLVAGAIVLIVLSIVIAQRYKNKDDYFEGKKGDGKDSVKFGLKNEVAKSYPLLPDETLDQYVAIKLDLEKLEKKLSDLKKIKFTHEIGNHKLNEEIADLERAITTRNAKISNIEQTHTELTNIAVENRSKYISIKWRITQLMKEKELYENKTDETSLDKQAKINDLIKQNRADLEMLKKM